MNLQAEIKWIHKELDEVKDPTLVEVIKNILKYRSKAPDSIEIKQYNIEIDASLAQVNEGETLTHKEMGEQIKQWAKQ